MEILLLLVEKKGELVTRDEIVGRVWGRETFLDTDNSINGAIRKLRQALRDDPEKPRVIQTITGKGYRFIAAVSEDTTAEVPVSPALRDPVSPSQIRPPSPEPEQTPGPRDEKAAASPLTSRWPILLGLAILLIAAPLIYLQRSKAPPAGRRLMLAVLPFENLTGDSSQEYFSDGLTEEMISRLGSLDPSRLGVIARTSVMPYKRSRAPLDRIGRELKVDYVLEGSVRRDLNKLRISAQLIRMSDRTHLWAQQYNREVIHAVAVQEEIAQAVADQTELTLGRGKRLDDRRQRVLSAEAYQAYDLYLKGRYFWNERTAEGFRQAVSAFQQAVEADPNYALAYAGLADSYALMSSFELGAPKEFVPKARAAALRALQLDDRLAEAHTSLALIDETYDWNWTAAEKEFRRALQLNPNYATAYHWFAEYLCFQGRFEEALAEIRRARALDPLSLIIASDEAAIHYFARQYDRAIAEFRAVLDREPYFPRAYMVTWAYIQRGMLREASAEIERWGRSEDGPWNWAARAIVDGRMGRAREAGRALARLEDYQRSRPSDPMPMLSVAYLGVDDKAKALIALEKLFRERSSFILTLKVEPLFDALREDPRFQELLRRAGLAE